MASAIRELGDAEIETFLSHLANERRVAASTYQQALAALLFLYGVVLGVSLARAIVCDASA